MTRYGIGARDQASNDASTVILVAEKPAHKMAQSDAERSGWSKCGHGTGDTLAEDLGSLRVCK